MKSYITIGFLGLLILFNFIYTPTVLAQISDPMPEFSLVAEPEFPDPLEEVTVSISSSEIPVNSVDYVWYLDSQEIASGKGVTSVSFPNSAGSESLAVSVLITLPDGREARRRIFVRNNKVDLLWYGETYTPPFYPGRSLPSLESKIHIVAIPGRSSERFQHSYEWRLNNTILAEDSGFAKNRLSFFHDNLNRAENASVLAAHPDSLNLSGQGDTIITPINPQLQVMTVDSVSGVRRNLDGNNRFEVPANTRLALVVEPFFFSVPNNDPLVLSYGWQINGQNQPVNQPPNELSILYNGDPGTASITTAAQHPFKLFQEVSRDDISIVFR